MDFTMTPTRVLTRVLTPIPIRNQTNATTQNPSPR